MIFQEIAFNMHNVLTISKMCFPPKARSTITIFMVFQEIAINMHNVLAISKMCFPPKARSTFLIFSDGQHKKRHE